MATTNPVFQVLTTSGNQAPLAAGSNVAALANGQIGVFNYHTGLSVDGSVASDCEEVFIAVGINRTTGGTDAAEDIAKSAGQMIQKKHTKALTVKGYVAEVPKVVEVSNVSKDATFNSFGLKIEFRSQKSYLVTGYNGTVKTFDGSTIANLIGNINADPDKLVTASAFVYRIQATIGDPTTDGTAVIGVGTESFNVALLATDTAAIAAGKIANAINGTASSAYSAFASAGVIQIFPKVAPKTGTSSATISLIAAGGTGVTVSAITAANLDVSDAAAFQLANPSAGVSIRLTGASEVRPAFNNDIHLKYHKTGTDFLVSLPYGFASTSDVTTVTALQYREGSGYDLKQLEYVAGGWNGKPGPYRQSTTTGMAREGFEYFISPSANYNVVSLAYDQEAVGGWEEYKNNLETIIAIPCADGTTLTGLATILAAAFPKFGTMANDVASMDCTNTRTGLLTASTDGIEIAS